MTHKHRFFEILLPLSRHEGVAEVRLALIERELNVHLPSDYRDFMLWSNGGDGWIGDKFLSLYSWTDLLNGNRLFRPVNPDLLVIGTDGGGEAFGFDRQNSYRVVMVPFVALEKDDYIQIGETFSDFVEKLAEKIV